MSGPGRFEALLSHRGPLVHVDHSHRAPAPTGFWPIDPRGWFEEKKEQPKEQPKKQPWMQKQGWEGTHKISVTAGQVRRVVAQHISWMANFREIQVEGDERKYSVQFVIDDALNVRYVLWETGKGDTRDPSSYVGEDYYWTQDQDEQYLYAPNAGLKPVLEEAAKRLLALPVKTY